MKQHERFRNVYISPDRSPEDRDRKKELVKLPKKRIEEQPQQYHYIHKGKVCSRAHTKASAVDEGPVKHASFNN